MQLFECNTTALLHMAIVWHQIFVVQIFVHSKILETTSTDHIVMYCHSMVETGSTMMSRILALEELQFSCCISWRISCIIQYNLLTGKVFMGWLHSDI